MRELPHFALLLVLLGCGGASAEVAHAPDSDRAEARPRDPDPSQTPPVAITEEGGRAPGTCPERFGMLGPTCQEGDFPDACQYPEGSCSCSTPPWCGGMAPPPIPPRWTCEAPPTPCPAAGTPCTAPAQCTEGPCGWSGVHCVENVWTTYHSSPPP